jgi:hypothetical protein
MRSMESAGITKAELQRQLAEQEAPIAELWKILRSLDITEALHGETYCDLIEREQARRTLLKALRALER